MFLSHFGLGLAAKRAAPTRARDRTGQYALWGLLLFLLAVWIGAVFGPSPPSERALMLSALGLWLVIPWGYWIDRHRTIRRTP
jgi:hypothetical protein